MFNRDIYRKTEEDLRTLRTEAMIRADLRRSEAEKRSPRIREIDTELSGIGVRIFRAACAGEDLAEMRSRNLALQKERREELKKIGLPEDYTDVHYTCPDCQDEGFVNMKMCHCFKQRLVNATIAASGMGRLISKQTFANYDLSFYNEEDRDVNANTVRGLKKFVEDFPNQEARTVVLMGKTGTGKTHLSSAVAGGVIEKGMDVLYDSFQNIVTAFEHDKFRSGYTDAEPLGNGYLTCDLLIIDDLGAEFTTSFAVTTLYHILSTRQNRELPTVITTNLSADEISEIYTDRVFSRFCGEDSLIYSLCGRDHRIHH